MEKISKSMGASGDDASHRLPKWESFLISASLLFLALLGVAIGCGDGVPVLPSCYFEDMMEENGCDAYNTSAVCVEGHGIFTCEPAPGYHLVVRTNATCYNSAGKGEPYPMFDLNEGCPTMTEVE